MAELTLDTLMDDGNYMGSEKARIENKVILDELERKKKARTMAVPTDDNRVKARLREIGEPITLFGERVGGGNVPSKRLLTLIQAADRRDRLIYVLSQINAARGDDAMHVDEEPSDESEEDVCTSLICFNVTTYPVVGGRILHTRDPRIVRSTETDSGIFSSQVGFCYR